MGVDKDVVEKSDRTAVILAILNSNLNNSFAHVSTS
jgi:hypothetical protein